MIMEFLFLYIGLVLFGFFFGVFVCLWAGVLDLDLDLDLFIQNSPGIF